MFAWEEHRAYPVDGLGDTIQGGWRPYPGGGNGVAVSSALQQSAPRAFWPQRLTLSVDSRLRCSQLTRRQRFTLVHPSVSSLDRSHRAAGRLSRCPVGFAPRRYQRRTPR
jgi:hypothetical protein